MIEIRWHGRGGQGAFTAAKILGAAAVMDSKFSLAFPSFGPERRGAPISAFNKIDSKPIINRSVIRTCDYMIFLDDSLFDVSYLDDLKKDGMVLINTPLNEKYSDFPQITAIDANKIAIEIINRPICNTAMLGALAHFSDDVSFSSIQSSIDLYLSKTNPAKNHLIFEKAYDYFKEVQK
ncbi:2-oxoacid:acceptor oxidoreductase family protein [Acetobacterium sp.]|uniref:2-oxoacid:acceptor oxidoreductase family protein n=1 Tax=Acetobacterium sp. TaxID=1872094 RepID=UPI002F40B14A